MDHFFLGPDSPREDKAMNVSRFLKGEDLDAKWYTIPETNVQVQIRDMKPHRRREIVRSSTITKQKRGQTIRDLDDKKLTELSIRECIVGWKNIEDENGEPLAFNLENAILLDRNWPDFAALWNSVVEDLATIADVARGLDEGNSESGGSST